MWGRREKSAATAAAEPRSPLREAMHQARVEAAERTYKQSLERINSCVSLKEEQEPQLASWLGQHGMAGGK